MENNFHLPLQTMREAWHKFVENGYIEKLPPLILNSWLDCKRLGLNPYQRKAPEVLSREELEAKKKQFDILLEVSIPVAINLYEFVKGSGFIITIADPEGYLLEIIGDKEVIETVKEGNFVEGANWSEKIAGNNGVGSCIKYNLPLQIYGYEHYCICSHKWTCSGAPIHNHDGSIIGALDMTAIREKVHPHTLGMVVGAVYAIERQLSLMQAWKKCEVADQYKNAIIDAISDSLIAIDSKYMVTHFNEKAQQLLGIKIKDAVGRNIKDIVGANNLELLNLINKKEFVTDYPLTVYSLTANKLQCNITLRPILSYGKMQGIILCFQGAKRVHRLANKVFGAKANLTFANLLGNNSQFLETIRMAKAAANSSCSILILGETGTGKEMFAQAIHNESPRNKGPFIAINCGAIPRELIASELFGYADGAFTGAKKGGKLGKFELADGGTIFLDEIGEMPLELQTVLLRVLEEKAITRVGGNDLIPIDVRIIAATNKNILTEIEKGNFRQDLYYRLNVITIHTVPLRDRPDDIKPLAMHFIKKVAEQLNKKIESIDDRIWEAFMAYNWPGNVRELHNVIERMVNIAADNKLTIDLLPHEIRGYKKTNCINLNISEGNFEKEEIESLLRIYNGNISQTAKKMGVSRTTLYRMIWKYNLNPRLMKKA